jgi:DNA-binding response OmpR family regulator
MSKKDKQKKKQQQAEKAKLLIVEDDLTLLETLEYNLIAEGYRVLTATNGLAALEVSAKEQPELVVLDVMLPGLDGFEVCRVLRRESAVPILMLTARAGETDRVVGLEVGAGDYLAKPFSMRELLARVKALLRRVRLDREGLGKEGMLPSIDALVFGDLTIDLDRHEAFLQSTTPHSNRTPLCGFSCRTSGHALSSPAVADAQAETTRRLLVIAPRFW